MGALTLFLALVLLMSAGHKLVERDRMAIAAARLTGATQAIGLVISLGAAACEAMAALALLLAASLKVGGLLAALIWSAYGVALARRFGTTLDCGCSFASHERPVDVFAVARAFGLAALALSCFALPGGAISILSVFAAFGFLALYLALGEIASITIPNRKSAA